MNIHLVDGTYELFRAYYGAPGATNTQGQEVGAARGLLRSLTALLGETGTTHVAIAFDTVIESFRNELFDGYKTGEGIEPALWAQFPLAERVARALGLTVWSMIEFEADDALATAAARFAKQAKVDRVLICSPDKDLAQCVRGDKVVTVDRMRGIELDHDGVVAKFGIAPASIPDYLALVGDSADGIPGIPRWGAKSTASVLAHYEHLEAIPDDAETWSVNVRGAKALAENLAARRSDALLYRRLATLRTDVPLTESLADLRWKGADQTALRQVCDELSAPKLADRALALRSK